MQVCESAANLLKTRYLVDPLKKGTLETNARIPNVCMWKEIFCNVEKYCNNKKDRYGFCNFCIDEHDHKLFKIRDEGYGNIWK